MLSPLLYHRLEVSVKCVFVAHDDVQYVGEAKNISCKVT